MENKANEERIIDYLYGEMSTTDLAMFKKELAVNSELKRQLDDVSGVSGHLDMVKDREVVIPPVMIRRSAPKAKGVFSHGAFRWGLSIAASLLILMVAGYLMDFKIIKTKESTMIGFGEMNVKPELSELEVKQWIARAVDQQQKETSGAILTLQTDLETRLGESEKVQEQAWNKALSKQYVKQEEIMQLYVAQLNDSNKKMIEDFFLVSNQTQKKYMNRVLADFSDFYQKQRSYDLEMIQSNLGMLENSYSTRQLEQENMLASLYNIVKTQSK
ncbi:hypothetical protein [Reichenbachiella sp. MSK19-1]|uniref:hypothetical protein n=1 Tax=Reichenbachiella sp. MSK19-1 TaxID=1897631 RepID=UPI000E6C8542|nr:hypothetical protein [Reichenbachiella sp. MSK19-1]RJE75130.1 hypothetical protein BGP76_18650 [Reichenbachiella sp. MSK19-1]